MACFVVISNQNNLHICNKLLLEQQESSDGCSWGQHNSSRRKTNEQLDWLMFGLERNALRSLPVRENGDTFTYGLVNLIIQESWLPDTPSIPQRGDCIYFTPCPVRLLLQNQNQRLFLNLWQILRPSNVSWGKVSATFAPSFHHCPHSSLLSLWALLRATTRCNSSLAVEASLGWA